MKKALLTVAYSLHQVLTLATQIYTESLLNDGSAPDDCSYSLYGVLTLTALTYTESLLNDRSASDGRLYSLYQVVTPRFHGYGDVTATYIRRSEGAPTYIR